MNTSEIRNILESSYDRKVWKNFLQTQFINNKLNAEDLTITLADNTLSKQCLSLGYYEINQYTKIGIFEVELNENVNLGRNRVALRNLLKDITKQMSGAMVVFVQGDKWRFSYISKRKIKNNATNEIEDKETAPKRYTYLFGKGEKARTAAERLIELTKIESQNSCLSLDDFENAFSVSTLTKEFYNELFKWYEWTLSEEVGVTFPKNTNTSDDDREKLEEQIIRLITRLLFVWFIKQKSLVPNNLFDTKELNKLLNNFEAESKDNGNYYNAILQNLFFATLNKAITERAFAQEEGARDIKTLYRYAEMFNISEKEIIGLFKPIPFLNGGLFECLDKEIGTDGVKYHLDGFSRNDKKVKGQYSHRAFIPNCVFFDEVKGIIPLLERFNFTVEENAPEDVQVALDPELLGNVFENLLGAFNTETKESARKQSGSFYTPRKIVDFMVSESLIAYLQNDFPKQQELIQDLFINDELPEELKKNEKLCKEISDKLKAIKIIDPACGSGAFPMGILNKMLQVLQKLDIENKHDIYDLKLHLIQECIYGVDLQTIAAQISKLRFFISLIVEQHEMDLTKPEQNYNVETLPNLETKFVAANTLLNAGSENKHLLDLKDEKLSEKKNELWKIREEHFYAKGTDVKKKLRLKDEKLREEIKNYIQQNATKPDEKIIDAYKNEIAKLEKDRKNYEGVNMVDITEKVVQIDMFGTSSKKQQSLFNKDINKEKRDTIDKQIKALQANIDKENNKGKQVGFEAEVEKLAKWNPYDQNASSDFFDAEWMFGIKDGFDIVIGNPPYISTKGIGAEFKKLLEKEYNFADDTYNHFYFKGIDLLKQNGVLTYITPKTFWTTQTKHNLRDLLLKNHINYIFDTANPFEAAMVDTCVISVSKITVQNNVISFLDGSKDLANPLKYEVKQEVYLNTQNSVIFKPTEENMKIFNLYGRKVKDLYNEWWDKISTSKNIEKNRTALETYRKNLKPGDIALLGCLTEGGQGLATANNGKYIAIRKSTKWAKNITESRPKKLAEAIRENNIKIAQLERYGNTTDFLNTLSETEIAELFDSLKQQYGRDIFGQGYIYRLVEDSEIADVDTLTEDEKQNGIDKTKNYYVPYDKGDKDGNRWYLETPFAIAWHKENVGFLKTNSGKKGEGMPVVRNPQYYFKEGFCWTNVLNPNARLLKAKLKQKTVNDVGSMSLSSIVDSIPNYYLVALLNSELLFNYYREYINNTVNIQINDIRQLPVFIPSQIELKQIKKLFDQLLELKKNKQENIIDLETELKNLEQHIDEITENLYYSI